MGVSRTVVREAVAALRADGLVVTRRGSGAYVAGNPTASPFRIVAPQIGRIEDVLDVMELRLAVEVEAAALAAERADRKHVAKVRAALRDIDRALRDGEGAVAEDFAFHRAIAGATGNAQFPRFLAFLGSHVIPRQSVRLVGRHAGRAACSISKAHPARARPHRGVHCRWRSGRGPPRHARPSHTLARALPQACRGSKP